jgi:hypothetical protein
LTENADLFWAIRGAGACFGIVSSFTFVAHPIPQSIWSGALVFTPDKLAQIVAFANDFDTRASKDENFSFVFSRPPDAGFQPMIMAISMFLGSEADGVEFFKDLRAIGPVAEHLNNLPYVAVNSMLNALMPFGGRRTMGGASFTCPLDPAKVQSAFNDYVSFTEETGIHDATMIWELLPYHKIVEVPIEAMAFPNRGQYYNLAMTVKWDDPALDVNSRDWVRDMGKKLRVELGTAPVKGSGSGVYSNYVCEYWFLVTRGEVMC